MRDIPGRILFQLTHKLRRSRTLELLEEIRSSPFLSPEEIRAGQLRRLSALLAIAEAHVPYYREMFRELGIHSCDIRTLEDFSRLPVLTKDILRERLPDLVREDLAKDQLIPGNSGGSTGVPVRFYRDSMVLDAQEAAALRNFLQAGWRPGEMIGFFWGWDQQLNDMGHWEFELRQRLRRQYQFDPFQSEPKQMDGWLEKWKRIRPTVAYGYASTISRFAAHLKQLGEAVPPLRGVFTTAEKLYRPQRDVISQVFGCAVYDCYGSSEVMNIATQCARGCMHVNADFVVLEADRSRTRAGEPAPLLVTGLWNLVMPFIRYRNEDCGELLDSRCDCGNHFPVMELNVARISDNFVFPSGRIVHGEFFTHLMYGSEGVLMFQFHQTAPDAITLWIVPGQGDASRRQSALRKVIAQVEELDVTGQVKVELREVDAIPLSAAGKHRFTRSDVSTAATSAQ
jgi:phenylacetate-CoA ligase